MMHPLAYPLRFAPVHKSFIWGGRRLAAHYGRVDVPETCGESWEISAHADGSGPLLNGSQRGSLLADLAASFRRELLGTASPKADRFPLLFKIIDAQTPLSVQVHPTPEVARRLGSECKNESWHLLGGAPDAVLYAGLQPGTTPERLRAALTAGMAESLLLVHPAACGETLFIPSGLVHAIGAGCLIYEVQQNANTTYRLYDWNRTDASGRRRPLHLEEALASIDWSLSPPHPERTPATDNVWQTCSATPFFTLRRICLTQPRSEEPAGRSFHVIFVAEGTCEIAVGPHIERLPAGSSCLVPACVPRYIATPVTPSASLLVTTL